MSSPPRRLVVACFLLVDRFYAEMRPCGSANFHSRLRAPVSCMLGMTEAVRAPRHVFRQFIDIYCFQGLTLQHWTLAFDYNAHHQTQNHLMIAFYRTLKLAQSCLLLHVGGSASGRSGPLVPKCVTSLRWIRSTSIKQPLRKSNITWWPVSRNRGSPAVRSSGQRMKLPQKCSVSRLWLKKGCFPIDDDVILSFNFR
jgi:hypothetical protein